MRRIRLILGLTAALVLVGGVAVASIPDANGVIHGCRKNSDGTLKVIDTAVTTTCPNGWTALNWSQGGLSGYEQVYRVWGPYPVGTWFQAYAICPDGKSVLGGGFDMTNGGSDTTEPAVLASGPSMTYPNTGMWNLTAKATTDLHDVIVYAICANIVP